MPGPTYHRGVGATRGPHSRRTRRRHQRAINQAARRATRTPQFRKAQRNPSQSSYAKRYAKPIAKAQNLAVRQTSRVDPSGIGRTLLEHTQQMGTSPQPSRAARLTPKLRQGLGESPLRAGLEGASLALPVGESVDALSAGIRAALAARGGAAAKDVAEAARVAEGTRAAGGAKTAEEAATGIRGGTRYAKAKVAAQAAAKSKAGRVLGAAARPVRTLGRGVERTPVGRTAVGKAAARGLRGTATTRAGKALGLAARHPIASSIPIIGQVQQGGVNPLSQATAFVQGTGQALLHPGQTIGTTGRVVESIPSALAAIPADAYLSAKEGSPKPLEGLAAQYGAYLGSVGQLASGDPNKVQQTIQEQTGLVPHLSALGIGYAGVRAAKAKGVAPLEEGIGQTKAPPKDTVAKAEELATAGTDRHRAKALEQQLLRDTNARGKKAQEGYTTRHGRRAQEARRGARRERGVDVHLGREFDAGHKLRGGKQAFDKLTGDLATKEIGNGITYADAASYIGAHGYTKATKNVLDRISRDRAGLKDSKRTIQPHDIADRAVLDALIANPERAKQMLADPKFQEWQSRAQGIQVGRATEAHGLRTGRAESTPEPKYARSAYQTQARAEGVLLPSERPHPEITDTKVQARSGHEFDKRVRANAKATLRKARDLRVQAEAIHGNPKVSDATAQARAATLKSRATKYEKKAEAHLAIVDRPKRAVGLRRKAAAAEAKGNTAEAQALRTHADNLDVAHEAAMRRRTAATQKDLGQLHKNEGLAPGTYFHQEDVTGGRGPSAGRVAATPTTRKERFKTGKLEQQGRVQRSAEDTLNHLVAGRTFMEQLKSSIDFVKTVPLNVRGAIFRSPDEWAQLRREGKIPKGFQEVPVQEFSGAIQRSDQLRKLYNDARYKAEVGKFKGGDRRHLTMMVPTASIKEFRAQYEQIGGLSKGLKVMARVQSAAMLATSPVWFAFQLIASPSQVLARNWSPARYARAYTAMREAWKNATPAERAEFEKNFGANSGDIVGLVNRSQQPYLHPSEVSGLTKSLHFAFKSPVGRFLHDVGENLKGGGPLIKLNRTYEAKIRRFAAFMEADRLAGLDAKGKELQGVVPYIAKTAGVVDTIYRHQQALKGLDATERLSYYNHHPEARAELESKLIDAMGEWSAMSKREKELSSVTVFYPFLRFSLRWMLYSFPKNNPIKMAILANAAQSNADELKKLLGGNPSFLQDWGNIVLHPSSGPTAINLARTVPGGNSLVEAIGTGKIDLSTIIRPAQPIIGTAVGALEGKTSTGFDTSTPRGILLARGLANLSPVTRPLSSKIGEQTATSQLFKAIQGKDSGYAASFAPQVVTDPAKLKEQVTLSHLLDVAYGPDQAASTKAWSQIDAMMRKYHIKVPSSSSSSSSSSSWYGSGGSSSSSWYGSSGSGSSGSWYGSP